MNRPSRNDEDYEHPDWNQSPHALAGDLTTRNDLNGIVNSRRHRDHRIDDGETERIQQEPVELVFVTTGKKGADRGLPSHAAHNGEGIVAYGEGSTAYGEGSGGSEVSQVHSENIASHARRMAHRTSQVLKKYARFIGPGLMISVAYIDPGNYATDVSAGATYRFKLLVMVLVSNCFAIYLQALCIRLGSVTGMNLAEMIKAHCPKWLNLALYVLGEAAIVATDIAEVIGTAIALNLLFHIPVVAGCAISIVDVLVILFFYRPSGTMRGLRAFEFFVAALVLGVVVCFCYQLSLIKNTSVGEVFRGYLPSRALVESQGYVVLRSSSRLTHLPYVYSLYQSCGILGATVMPHSLYLGSGLVQARLRDFDVKNNSTPATSDDESTDQKYQPSLSAVRSCMKYSIVELAISLFVFALFVNSAILIVAGASLSGNAEATNADLFGIHTLLSHELAPVAGTIFALALLLSGTSAGIVCTIAGQMLSEGQLNWSVKPWVRRLMTRSLSITPSIIIAGAVGREGLSAALEASQVALSVILPFVSAPLIYFTCRDRYMTMTTEDGERVKMRNGWFSAVWAVLIWLIIVIMNVALLVLLGLGVN